MIDALDESHVRDASGQTIADLLCRRTRRLPAWLRVIATTRNDPEILQRFSDVRVSDVGPPVEIRADNRDRLDDIDEDLRRFIASWLGEPNMQERSRRPK